MGGVGGALAVAITSSILRIIDTDSLADLIICSFTARGSYTSSLAMSFTLPPKTSTPAHFSPFSWLDRNSTIMSIGSRPAFSANVFGTTCGQSLSGACHGYVIIVINQINTIMSLS